MWEKKDRRVALLKEVQDEPIHSLPPLGSPVIIAYRRLTMSQHSGVDPSNIVDPDLGCIKTV